MPREPERDDASAKPAIDRDSVRVRLVIRGRVQGVWFRGSAREQALARGIRGWARNRADGSVEIVAEGEGSAVEEFVAWCGHGPSGAHVASLTRAEEPPGERLGPFQVRA